MPLYIAPTKVQVHALRAAGAVILRSGPSLATRWPARAGVFSKTTSWLAVARGAAADGSEDGVARRSGPAVGGLVQRAEESELPEDDEADRRVRRADALH